jgi:hypothetical protein
MPGVPRELIEHELHLGPNAKPVTQCLHRLKNVIKREIARLLDVDFIKEVATRISSPIPYLYLKRIKIGGCVLIILISTRHVKRSIQLAPNQSSRGLHSWL